jgi:predicted amidohydrolase
MKLAAAAFPIDWHNRWNDYVGKLRVWVRTAAEQGAELIVFPEYGALELASLAEEENARDPQRATEAVTARIKDVDELHGSLAREFKLYICAASGPVRRQGGASFNRVRLFAPDGRSHVQEKLVPSQAERDDWGIVPGGSARVFETALGRIGILIGGDVELPLIARAMVEAGAELLLAPTASDSVQGFARVRLAAMARALEGQCVVVHAVTVGDAGWLPAPRRSVGTAAVYGPLDLGFPEDGTIAAGKPNTAGWVHAEVSLEAIRKAREEGSVRILRDWDAAGPALAEVEVVALTPPPPEDEPEAGA